MGFIFADIRKINNELLLAEEALQNSGLEEFTGMGYEDMSDKITKIYSALVVLESVPPMIVSDYVDDLDSAFEEKISSRATGIINELQMDEIGLNNSVISGLFAAIDGQAKVLKEKLANGRSDVKIDYALREEPWLLEIEKQIEACEAAKRAATYASIQNAYQMKIAELERQADSYIKSHLEKMKHGEK